MIVYQVAELFGMGLNQIIFRDHNFADNSLHENIADNIDDCFMGRIPKDSIPRESSRQIVWIVLALVG